MSWAHLPEKLANRNISTTTYSIRTYISKITSVSVVMGWCAMEVSDWVEVRSKTRTAGRKTAQFMDVEAMQTGGETLDPATDCYWTFGHCLCECNHSAHWPHSNSAVIFQNSYSLDRCPNC